MESEMLTESHMQSNFNTLLIHGGIDGDERTGAVSVPIYQTSTYRQIELGQHKGYEYSRTGNPTREALEALINQLEGGEAGFAFASGMAAITAVLLLLKSGDRVIISNNVYGGTFRVLDKVFKNFGLEYEIADTSNIDEVESKVVPGVAAVIVESPANPLLTITDIGKVAGIARKNRALTIVDNTFMTPYLQRPLELGADIVIHSATKYLGGHSDVIAGLVVVKDSETAARLKFLQNATGGVLPPFDSWLLLRGIKTLAVRLDRHIENSRHVVDFLKNHEGVTKIYYPGLEVSEGYEIHKKQAYGPGAMISFVLSEDYDIKLFFKNVSLITLGESLGGVESLVSHPASMTHASIPYEIRQKVGIVDNLIRLSVGIEDKEAIINDLGNAFNKAKRK
ncbi:trans-sulfuration enzyme family protein [Ruminiclostridium cellobioparum]|uniref:Cystathionine beta-lyase/cystathionine gamma-synthase n=1 Tax=Ruminiclostridium cellobioparum subsp. termitidis CT1112 TaxID=1195236 RepID=S0FHU7_RUMCE|nr:PLP-dependent transferase [Ruminiclostridium cellobioparum]EMS71117.1 cystathionine beta-lyase/cystathionine gamma-synthase [Ruminiclostridium cellobioparum subsp. termitidis CT1112]